MTASLMATKLGMTRVYNDVGVSIPVTVLRVGPCFVTQLRTMDRDGYSAVQIGFGAIKPRNSTIPQIAHDAKAGAAPQRTHREFRVAEADLASYELGQELGVEVFADLKFVDVTGTSKGKGFAGGMKRHGFKGQQATHGVERKHRSPGSIGGHANNAGKAGRIKKGKKMAGHMGDVRRTMSALRLLKVIPEHNLILVRGSVPGAIGSLLLIRAALKKG